MEKFKLTFDISKLNNSLLTNEEVICFWKEYKDYGFLSQWFGNNKKQFSGKDLFLDSDNVFDFYNCEQYMMFQKASLFKDKITKNKIIKEHNPQFIKKLGREVRNFNNEVWNQYKEFIIYQGNLLKFTENKNLKNQLLKTENKILIEASPFDTIYGVGLDVKGFDKNKNKFNILNVNDWKGTNLLGFTLMQVRDFIQKDC